MILALPVLVSIAVGYIRKGRLSGIVQLRLRGLWLAMVAFAMEAATGWAARRFPGLFPQYMWAECLLQYGLLFTFVLLNIRLKPVAVMGFGMLLNFLVMMLNGGRMPVLGTVREIEWCAEIVKRIESGEIPEYFIMRGGEALWFLGDVLFIPVRGIGFGSAGDFILAAGMFWLVQAGMAAARPKHAKGGGTRERRTRTDAPAGGRRRPHS